MLLISLSKVQRKIVESIRARRLQMELTQEDLSERAGSHYQHCENLNKRE